LQSNNARPSLKMMYNLKPRLPQRLSRENNLEVQLKTRKSKINQNEEYAAAAHFAPSSEGIPQEKRGGNISARITVRFSKIELAEA